MKTPTIDPEFKALIPPLAPDEYAQLEANICAEGCRDPLVLWDGIIIDGHNRYEICTKHGIGFEKINKRFDDRNAVMLWMEENQIGRRNLDDDQRSVIADSIRERRSKSARSQKAKEAGKQGGRGNTKSPEDNVSPKLSVIPKQRTRTAVAKELNIPERKLRTVQEVKKAAPELIQKVRDGEMKLAEAKRIVKRAEVVEKLESVAAVEAKKISGEYDVIVMDPPWKMEKIERDVAPNQVAFEYPTMDEAQLVRFWDDVDFKPATDCHIWMWTTHKHLPLALRLLDAWGMKYVCAFVWHKPGGFQPFGLPQYNCEFAIYARKGTPQFIDTKAFPVCFDAPRGAHSEKPEAFYDVVRRVTAGRRIDVFNRRKIDGFDTWGKEAADA